MNLLPSLGHPRNGVYWRLQDTSLGITTQSGLQRLGPTYIPYLEVVDSAAHFVDGSCEKYWRKRKSGEARCRVGRTGLRVKPLGKGQVAGGEASRHPIYRMPRLQGTFGSEDWERERLAV